MSNTIERRGDKGQQNTDKEKPVYRPNIEFEEFGLVVSFDHALQTPPEELFRLGQARNITSFVISPRRELYIGLRFVTPATLYAVNCGLQTYLEDETLSDDQRRLIQLGVRKLNDFLNPKRSRGR